MDVRGDMLRVQFAYAVCNQRRHGGALLDLLGRNHPGLFAGISSVVNCEPSRAVSFSLPLGKSLVRGSFFAFHIMIHT